MSNLISNIRKVNITSLYRNLDTSWLRALRKACEIWLIYRHM